MSGASASRGVRITLIDAYAYIECCTAVGETWLPNAEALSRAWSAPESLLRVPGNLDRVALAVATGRTAALPDQAEGGAWVSRAEVREAFTGPNLGRLDCLLCRCPPRSVSEAVARSRDFRRQLRRHWWEAAHRGETVVDCVSVAAFIRHLARQSYIAHQREMLAGVLALDGLSDMQLARLIGSADATAEMVVQRAEWLRDRRALRAAVARATAVAARPGVACPLHAASRQRRCEPADRLARAAIVFFREHDPGIGPVNLPQAIGDALRAADPGYFASPEVPAATLRQRRTRVETCFLALLLEITGNIQLEELGALHLLELAVRHRLILRLLDREIPRMRAHPQDRGPGTLGATLRWVHEEVRRWSIGARGTRFEPLVPVLVARLSSAAEEAPTSLAG